MCVDEGVRNHIRQCELIKRGEVELGEVYVRTPHLRPVITIAGASIFIGELKFGSMVGATKSQLVMAPPLMARRVRAERLMICVFDSVEYWGVPLFVDVNKVNIIKRAVYAVVRIVATINIKRIIILKFVMIIDLVSMIRSLE